MKILWEQNQIKVGEQAYSPDQVLKNLQDFVSPERREKVDQVLRLRSAHFVSVLEGLYDRGNISAVMRSAEAFGFFKMHIIEKSEKFKESQRVTQGADKWLEVQKWKSTRDCLLKLKSEGYKIYSTHLSQGALSFDDLDLGQKTAVIFGNEKEGVSQEALELSDGNVLLPMSGFTQSFNISVAAALSFQRAFLKEPPRLKQEEAELLKASYYLRSISWPHKALVEHLANS